MKILDPSSDFVIFISFPDFSLTPLIDQLALGTGYPPIIVLRSKAVPSVILTGLFHLKSYSMVGGVYTITSTCRSALPRALLALTVYVPASISLVSVKTRAARPLMNEVLYLNPVVSVIPFLLHSTSGSGSPFTFASIATGFPATTLISSMKLISGGFPTMISSALVGADGGPGGPLPTLFSATILNSYVIPGMRFTTK